MNAFIKLLYALLIAISVAVFIGVGIVSFYAPPKSPQYPAAGLSATGEETPAEKSAREKYDADTKIYDTKQDAYQRNVTYIVLPLAAVTLAAGIYLMRKPGVIGEGLALGGIMTAAYGIITASIAGSSPLRFIAVALLLIGVLLTSHLRFGKEPKFSTK